MFTLAIIIGIYSYLIFFLGISQKLSYNFVAALSLFWLLFSLGVFRKNIVSFQGQIINLIKKLDRPSLTLIFLLAIQIIVNFIGVLGPEITFDALWYHLTLPKLYILNNSIFHIPGNLFYYSDMPKLTEMLYVPSLMFGNEIVAKLIHFMFGILSLIVIYKISRKFLPKTFSILAVLVFYSNLIVGWESISAYIDLARTFFEIMSLWGFLNWIENRQRKWLAISASLLGFAIASKVIALESLIIFFVLFAYLYITEKEELTDFIKSIFTFVIFSVLIPLPWFLFSFINTGNPLYPFFDKRIDIGTNFAVPNISNFFRDIINLFIYSNDPISPIYLIVFPLLVFGFFKAKKEIKIICIYLFLALIAWYITPRVGGGRFIIPYLPAFSVIVSYSIYTLKESKVKILLIVIVVLISLSSLGYRAIANKRYVSVILGKETKAEYLTKHLNFSFGDFYDTDNYFKNNIKPTDKVLLLGFHNLYYVNFPFIDSSWVKKGDKFNYIAVQNSILPEKFIDWQQIYYNPVTRVKLYSLKGKQWVY